MTDSTVNVEYRATASFGQLIREAAKARMEMAALNREVERNNRSTAAQAAAAVAARRAEAQAAREAAAASKDEGRAARESGQDLLDLVARQAASTAETVKNTKATRDLGAASRSAGRDVRSMGSEADTTEKRLSRARTTAERFFLALRGGKKDRDEAASGLKKISDGLGTIADARPGALPPFALIVPVIAALLGLIGPALAGVGALGAAALGLAANIASAASSAAVALPILAGLATVVGTLKLATGGVGKAVTTGDTKGLSKSAATFVTTIRSMRTEFDGLKRSVQERFFSGFTSDLDDLNKILPVARTGLSAVAGALGTVVGYLLKKISAPAWLSDFSSFTGALAKDLPVVGRGLGSVLDIARNLGMAALPVLSQFVGDAASAAAHVEAMVQSGRDSGALTAFLQRSADRLRTWLGIARNLGTSIVNYGRAAAPLGDAIAKGLLALTAAWSKASADALGPNSSFRRYILDVTPLIKNLGGVITDALGFLKTQFMDPENIRQMNALVTVIRTQLGPALGSLIATLAKSGIGVSFAKAIVAITTAITSLLQHGGVQGLKAFWTVVAGLAGAMSDIVRSPFGGFLSSVLLPPLIVLAGLALPLRGVFAALSSIAGLKAGGGLTGLVAKVKALAAGGGAGEAAGGVGATGAGGVASTLAGIAAPLAAIAAAGAAMVVVANALGPRAATTKTYRQADVDRDVALLTTPETRRGRGGQNYQGAKGSLDQFADNGGQGGFANSLNAFFGGQTSTRIRNLDTAMSQMVKSGDGDKARAIIERLGISAKTAAIDFPAYTSAVEANSKAAAENKKQLELQKQGLDDATLGFKTFTDKAAISAQTADDAATAIKGAGAAFKDSAKQSKDGTASLSANTAAGRTNRQTFIAAMGAIQDHAKAMRANGSTTQDVRAYTLAQIKTLQDQASKAGISKQAIGDLTKSLYAVPRGIVSNLDVKTADAAAKIAAIKRTMNNLNGTAATVYINAVASGISTGRASQISKNAAQFGGATGGYVGPWMNARGYDTGGRVQKAGEWRRGPRDTIPAWLEEGEFVVRKQAVDAIGLDRLRLINEMTAHARTSMGSVPNVARMQSQSVTQQAPFIAGDLIVNNPRREETGESLARQTRRLSYLAKGYRR